MSKLDLKPGDVVVFNNTPEGLPKHYVEARLGVIQTRSEETTLAGYDVYYLMTNSNDRERQIKIKAEQVISKLLTEALA
jgi:hypothetical protein